MANTQAVCTSFKTELLLGQHQLGAATLTSRTSLTSPTTDTFKAALYLASATYNAATSAYSATGEVSGTNYTAGGMTFSWTAPTASGTTTYTTPSAAIAWTAVTLASSFDAVLLYNSTQSNRAVAVYTFGAQTVTAGNFTINMPTNDSTNGLLRLT